MVEKHLTGVGHPRIMPKLYNLLKKDGRILVIYMTWLPFEDKIAGKSEKLVLQYSPNWSGARETMHPIGISGCYQEKFEMVYLMNICLMPII